MPSNAKSRNSRIASVSLITTLLLLACVTFNFQKVTVSHARLQSQLPESSRSPQSCSSCAGQGQQTIYAPLIRVPESSNTEINLNCRSPHVMDVTPTFYTEDGDAIVGDSFQMQAAEVKTVDLKTLMPHRIQNRQNLGGMTLSYFGYPLEMWAQLRLMHVARGGSVDVTFANLKDQRSNEVTLSGRPPDTVTRHSQLEMSEVKH